ncbi:MAG: glycosyltransferase family 39 protein [Fuerstiella sp.]|nr:glycosyltransferase family 39 protein [Fuerstiella sp.]
MPTLLQRSLESPQFCGFAAFVMSTVILLGHYSTKYGLNTPPSASGDEFSYDSIGWNLAHSAGFAEGGSDPVFHHPYDQAGKSESENAARRGSPRPETVAHRPPLFPVALAGLNTVFGRQFWAVRIMNVLASAATCGLLVWYLTATQRNTAAIIAFCMFLVVDTRTRLYGRAILTEATATFLTTVATLLLIHLSNTVRLRNVTLMGIVGGVMILDRTVFALWIPGIALIVAVLSYQSSHISSTTSPIHSWRHGFSMALVFVFCAALVVLPWSWRNINVLGTMMPLGTQGMTQLPAGFSDRAVQTGGVWEMESSLRLARSLDLDSMTRIERDVVRAQLGKTAAFEWIRNHPVTSIWLAVMKIWQEYRPRTRTEWFIGTSALAGLVLTSRRRETQVFLALHTVSCFAIGCTWSVEGRFVVPLVFSIHVLAANTLASPTCLIRRWWSVSNTLRLFKNWKKEGRSSDNPE